MARRRVVGSKFLSLRLGWEFRRGLGPGRWSKTPIAKWVNCRVLLALEPHCLIDLLEVLTCFDCLFLLLKSLGLSEADKHKACAPEGADEKGAANDQEHNQARRHAAAFAARLLNKVVVVVTPAIAVLAHSRSSVAGALCSVLAQSSCMGHRQQHQMLRLE